MIIDQILYKQIQTDEQGNLKVGLNEIPPVLSSYMPSEEERLVRSAVVDAFRWADVILRKPRREYNDMSTLTRMMIDQMSFNIYQPFNGDSATGDQTQNWHSNAVRPIVRNKVMSIAAHVTAKLLFPKIFAYNEMSDEQKDAAEVMEDLVEWGSDQNDYANNTLHAVINACVNPLSVTHIEYADAYRTVKRKKDDSGKWIKEEIKDEDNSGFKLTQVPLDEFFPADFYESNIQKQRYVIWRRVQTYEQMAAKYSKFDNFKFVRPGVQVIYNDANSSFYEVYDANLRQDLCEEVLFYSNPLDLFLIMVNGVLLTEFDNPNPRMDKNYPFICFYYEPFDEGRALFGKSLAFKMQPDADIINTLYPLIIDATYLNTFAPMIISGEEEVGSDIMVPGMSTTLINPTSSITPLRVAQDIRQGMETLFKVEESINESTEQPLTMKKVTAYQISKIEQERNALIGPFVQMMSSYVKQYGKLIMSDIIQYLTLPEVDKIVDDGELIYKTFIVNNKASENGVANHKINFDLNLPKSLNKESERDMSFKILDEQGGVDSKNYLYKINPKLFRELKYKCVVSPDVITPMSDDLERAFGLEIFDKSIQASRVGVAVDMEEIYKEFILNNYPKSKKDPEKFIKQQDPLAQVPQVPGQELQMGQPNQTTQNMNMAKPQPQQSPLNSMMKNNLIK